MIAVLSGAMLTACSPPPIAIAAVYLNDGLPTAVFHPCPGTEVYQVSVMEEPATPAATGVAATSSPSNDQRFWTIVDFRLLESRQSVTEVRLLETPSGWEQQITAPGALLTAFADDRTYYLYVQTTKPDEGVAAVVQFTLDDLRSLAEGQVWALPRTNADEQAMSREDFEKAAARSC